MTTTTMGHAERLLRRTSDGGVDPSLSGHLSLHGPLALPGCPDPLWAETLLAEVAGAGLTGHGGGGFPTALKWEATRRSGRSPVVVVNAMEGEPASAKDRTLLACAPHLVLDGADLVAAVTGSRSIVVCVPDADAPSARSVHRAIGERRGARGGPAVTVEQPPGRYITGEESALVHWLTSGDARPVVRVDKSVALRLGRRPVLVHNAETLAQVALVARHGSGWFRSVGTREAPGTTLVSVSGAVHRPGVVEVEQGTPVDEIVGRCDPMGASPGYLVGGYGGAWLAAEHRSTPFAPDPLARVGATQGVGIVVALSAGSCGIAETARIVRWMAGESAGQCGPCVFGLPAIADDLEALARGRADSSVMGRIDERTRSIVGRGACRHPDGVSRMVRSALHAFAADAATHAAGHPCEGRSAPSVLSFPERPPVVGAAS